MFYLLDRTLTKDIVNVPTLFSESQQKITGSNFPAIVKKIHLLKSIFKKMSLQPFRAKIALMIFHALMIRFQQYWARIFISENMRTMRFISL